MSKTTIFEDENFEVKAELYKGNPFLHIDVYNFSHKVFKMIKLVFEGIKFGFYMEGYDSIYAITPKIKFASKLGGKLLEKNEEDWGFIQWELKQP